MNSYKFKFTKRESVLFAVLCQVVFVFLGVLFCGNSGYAAAACSAPFDVLKNLTESFLTEMYHVATQMGVFYNLIPRTQYPHEQGLTRSVFTIGRSMPTTDEPEFEPVTQTTDDVYTGSCGTVYNQVPVGFDQRNYSPEKFGWKGPIICSDDLIYAWNVTNFWESYIPAMAKNTIQTIDNRYGVIFDHFVPKAAATADFEFTAVGTGSPAQSPDLTLPEATSELTQQQLDRTAEVLNEEGAFEPVTSDSWFTLGGEGNAYPLQIGQIASQRLFLNNPDRRTDYRFAFEGSGDANPVIRRIGASTILGNFRHLIVAYPPRYTYDAETGAYVRVPTWVSVAGTKGAVSQLNPDWRTAPYEGARVLSPDVFTSEVISPVNALAGMNFQPKNYMGDWMFIDGGWRIQADCADPLGKLGQHFAEFLHAPRPVKPTYGRLLIFKRCVGNLAVANCQYS